jgi:hypothetical protein
MLWKSIVNYAQFMANITNEGTFKTMVYNVQRWAGEQMFTMKSEVVGHL